MNSLALFSKTGISSGVSQDVILIFLIIFFGFLLGMLIGRHRLISVLINIYVSLAIVKVFPIDFFPEGESRAVIFLLLVAGLTVFGKKLFDIYISGSGTGFLWRVFVMSFLEVVLLVSILLSFLPKSVALEWVSENAYQYLVADWWSLIWMIAPMVLLLVIHRRIHR